jgi:phage terminase large subunit
MSNPVVDLTKWDFLPAQKRFFKLVNVEKIPYVAYIGGFGAGKTWTGALQAILTMIKYPGSYGLIGRFEATALRNTSMRTFIKLLNELKIPYEERKHENLIRIPLTVTDEFGKPKRVYSEALCWHLDNIDPIASLNIDWFWLDEAYEIPEDSFLMLQARLRGELGQPLQGWITTTPNGHDWIYQKFVAPALAGRQDLLNDYRYVLSKTSENHHLPSDLVSRLYRDYPEEWRKRYLDAEFNVFEGQIYTEFDEAIHVIDPIDIPRGWGWFRVIDPGYRNPTAVIWGAVDFDGRIYIVSDYLVAQQPLSVHAQNIIDRTRALTGQPHVLTLIDPAAKQRTANSELSVIEQLRSFGIYAEPANNDVWAGIQRVKQYFIEKKLFIFKTCQATIQELKNYRWKPKRVTDLADPKEEPLKKDDHLVDCVRYIVMKRISVEQEALRNPYYDVNYYTPHYKITGY